MKRYLLAISCFVLSFAAGSVIADDADVLKGKWLVKKANEKGVKVSQTIEVKPDKFIFQILDAEDHLILHAEGSFKLQKLGPFSSARFFNIRGGDSPSNLDDVDEEYTAIYTLSSDTWTIASNFDKKRDQKPSIDVYQRVASANETGTLVIDAIEMKNTPQNAIWFLCFEANVGEIKAKHYQADKGYDKNLITIPLALALPKVQAGQKCRFKMQLDDIDEDACGDEPDNRSSGEFTITEKGSASFKPEANWEYTLRWHFK